MSTWGPRMRTSHSISDPVNCADGENKTVKLNICNI